MKRPEDVGKDFDDYAAQWRQEGYQMESGWSAGGVDRDESVSVARPGDEWGDTEPLRIAYGHAIERLLPPDGPVNVLEIGAGGGRSTAVLLDALGDRCSDYHIVDVSEVFVDVLRERINHPLTIHIVRDVDLSDLPAAHFDFVLSQSAWSHISLYDQYRYLRDLRRVMKYRAPIFVHGQFVMGVGNDWGWNRFKRRVYQIDHRVEGVYHEFTGIGALVEMLVRLEYEISCVMLAGFVAKRIEANPESAISHLNEPLVFPWNADPVDYLSTGRTRVYELPSTG